MNNELIKMKDMDILEQKFQGDSIMTVKLKGNGKVYVGVKWITQALGFNKTIMIDKLKIFSQILYFPKVRQI